MGARAYDAARSQIITGDPEKSPQNPDVIGKAAAAIASTEKCCNGSPPPKRFSIDLSMQHLS
ncbi:uncharacterized protein Z519_04286 [Cladophialophora bantiana CBS 173.52]|uniref:Uncharacterized protein n=1 Tax=Cladophialophora bantiana (strain ATCC 10958 / CBS 173.52 / CDC B-1940 / NIH 8579) TaxID=1442370 RepID=A0A0D2F0G2_CLAB1|nr:uncharacterized protein Z519_04286 [Cladophialophora bantiana CBS 173.52]KIW95701.1 hypothetical protein Z519_04286 [Cladophialophora bantiana CBS 173.52]